MRVLVDGIHVGPKMKGVGRYVVSTLREMLRIDETMQLHVLMTQPFPFADEPLSDRVTYVPIPWRNHFWHGFRILPDHARQIHPDIIYIPYEAPVGSVGRPYAMVCHDIAWKIRKAQSDCSGKAQRIRSAFRSWIDDRLVQRSLRTAARVFSNSRYVAEWLKAGVGLDGSRITLAPCAPGADFFGLSQGVDIHAVRERLGSPQGYILVFFTGDARENFAAVVRGYEKVLENGFAPNLVVAGVSEGARLVEEALTSVPWRHRVRVLPFIEAGSEQKLAEIYTSASLYLDPSLQEGFGMQVVEAMACGTPVVCSNRSALPEVAGQAALLVDPDDPTEIASAVGRVLSDVPLQKRLRTLGHQRASSFSWAETAKATHQGLLEAMQGAA